MTPVAAASMESMVVTTPCNYSTMQVLRLPDLSWLYPLLSVFLWTIDFTHGVLKGEERAKLLCLQGSHARTMNNPLLKHMAVNMLFIVVEL